MDKHFEAFPRLSANFVPLTPISFLARAGAVFGADEAHVYGATRRSWAEVRRRCLAVAAALAARGIRRGDTVSVLAPNIPQTHELHFAVPMAGAVLNTINTRLEAETVAYILDHSNCRLLIADSAYRDLVQEALSQLGRQIPVVVIRDSEAGNPGDLDGQDYEDLAAGDPGSFAPVPLDDEWRAIALNYTSGTSGRPKGVVYHHRGAYLMSLGTIAGWQVPARPTYLSVVPMFHCNGWNHPWAMAIVGARLVFTRDLAPERVFGAIADERVTHFGAAPVVLSMLADSVAAPRAPFDPPVRVMTAGAPPPPSVLEKARKIGFDVMQVYGLTETYGHIAHCLWRNEWDDMSPARQADMQAMQGVAFPMVEGLAVFAGTPGAEVPHDGAAQGEVAIRGNTVMKGYYKDPAATEAAFRDGWFWSGDAAVVEPSGYIRIRDRLKDVIISGGENVSSVEVEAVLHRHPAVQLAAVVAQPDPRWGEVPCAFVELRTGFEATESEIVAYCRERLAGFKTPKRIVFGELPKTATGKVQKFLLREIAGGGRSSAGTE